MAAFRFSNAIINKQPIEVYNHGNMKRDFTYIDDVIESMFRLIKKDPPTESLSFYRIYNIGNHQPVQLNYFIQILEEQLGKKAVVKLLPLQPGDVLETYADIDELVNDIDFKPATPIEDGICKFVHWFIQYYRIP
jgi:UDP-glucuronate 4-epimerase